MRASLVAIAGPLQGSVFPLQNELSIGRSPENTVVVEDAALSRRHFTITERDGRFELRDAASRNGTRVNGVPVAAKFLEPQDEIRAGRSVFLFVVESDTSIVPPGRGPDLNVEKTVLLSRADALYARPEPALAQAPDMARTTRDLTTLLRIASVVPEKRGADGLFQAILELSDRAVPARASAVLLISSADDVEVASERCGSGQAEGGMFHRSLIDRAISDRIGVLGDTALVVPVVARERVSALLYFDGPERGAFDRHHLELAMGIANIVAGSVESALEAQRLERENRRLRAEINIEHDMVGSAPAMRQVFNFIARAAPADSTVLLRGESGTGKELVARAIHRNSARASQPFLAINCAALTETLLESELFGYEKGAFTGALNQKRGKFEEAQGGTLFLDEVGELVPALQAKLLRVLQECEFFRVGGNRPIRTDVRVIAATNRDIEQAVRDRSFRQDLYYRLNVVSVTLPPLRERREDIPALAEFFIQKHARRVKRTVTGISPEAAGCLQGYEWPGNVRELENAIERAAVLGSTELIVREDLPEAIAEAARPAGAAGGDFHDLVVQAKRRIVLDTLERAGGSISEAARLLGLHPNNLHRLIRTLELRPEMKRRAEDGDGS
ncbi:MAG TPA: sigma 54-interacting transcriptional regulator [Bryobacteraceae bacterium]|nr:sigma 54-interacting transcriptional regulator [Bryobacteraceae bacterium]